MTLMTLFLSTATIYTHTNTQTIPATGLTMWFSLDKKTKPKAQGLIHVRLVFSAEKNPRVAAQEHRHLLQILLDHELDAAKWQPFCWAGQFSAAGQAVLTQHAAQSGLQAGTGTAFARWSAFAALHATTVPLSFGLFDVLLDKLLRPLQSTDATDFQLCDADVTAFWFGVCQLLPSCFTVIRKMRSLTSAAGGVATADGAAQLKQIGDVLGVLSKVARLQPPPGVELLPRDVYGWLANPIGTDSGATDAASSGQQDVHFALLQAIRSAARDWFELLQRQTNGTSSACNGEQRLQHLVELVRAVRADVLRAAEHYDPLFQSRWPDGRVASMARECFAFYETRLAELVQPMVAETCAGLKRLSLPDGQYRTAPEHVELNMGTTLFEVYLALKRFVELGERLAASSSPAPSVTTAYAIAAYPQWFTSGVSHWLEISVYKALIRIERAIELDVLQPVDETVKFSSSAVDTLAIFYQIKIFWQQLAWPDVEGAYAFVAKIVDDICRCCVFYADRMAQRLEGLGSVRTVYVANGFEVTREWCLAINNIDYIRETLEPFVRELRVDEIILRLADYRSAIEAERCANTMKAVIENAVDTERNKILELIEVLAQKMSPSMRRYLTEGAELLHQDSNSMDRLMNYLEDSLRMLNAELNEVNFARVLDAIWMELSAVLYDLVQSNLDVSKT